MIIILFIIVSYNIDDYMSESKNEKQMIKSQIELLKQKYLKKSVAVQPNQSEKQAIVDIEIPKAKPGIEKK